MALLTNVRMQIVESFCVQTPYSGLLPKTFDDQNDANDSDDSFIIHNICAHGEMPEDETESLRITIQKWPNFSWPLSDLVTRYELFQRSQISVSLWDQLSSELQTLNRELIESLHTNPPQPHTIIAGIDILREKTKALNLAIMSLLALPGITLEHKMIIAPRCVLKIDTSKGTPCHVHVTGLRAIELR